MLLNEPNPGILYNKMYNVYLSNLKNKMNVTIVTAKINHSKLLPTFFSVIVCLKYLYKNQISKDMETIPINILWSQNATCFMFISDKKSQNKLPFTLEK